MFMSWQFCYFSNKKWWCACCRMYQLELRSVSFVARGLLFVALNIADFSLQKFHVFFGEEK
jgi:hypothetical protein